MFSVTCIVVKAQQLPGKHRRDSDNTLENICYFFLPYNYVATVRLTSTVYHYIEYLGLDMCQ